MTSCALRPASRARNAPALWMPSCELPARRMTASLMLSGRRSARSEAGWAGVEEAEDSAAGIWAWVLDGVTVSPMGKILGLYPSENIAACQQAMRQIQKKTSNAQRPMLN